MKVPFLVRVSVLDLNIRTSVGTDYPRTGMFTGIGTSTIVVVKEGKGSSEGWEVKERSTVDRTVAGEKNINNKG